MGRTETLVRKCRKRGGDCPCEGWSCAAIEAAHSELIELEDARRRIAELESYIERLKSPFANLRPDFVHDPPDQSYYPTISLEDGVWGYENEDGDFVERDGWPFDRDYVWPDDCERLGFHVA